VVAQAAHRQHAVRGRFFGLVGQGSGHARHCRGSLAPGLTLA
jgi:hypothetical protein